MKKQLIFLLFILLFSIDSFSQISIGGLPYSFTNNNKRLTTRLIDTYNTAEIDLLKLEKEDSIDNRKGRPFRFGYDFDADLNLNNSGTWTTLDNGDRIWQLAINSPKALTINLIFDKFYIPDGGLLYLYNKDRSNIIGGYTSANNSIDSLFATTIIRGEEIILEYYEPYYSKNQAKISISKVIHGYKDIFTKSIKRKEKSFGGSGSCNVNINCDEAKDWQKEKRAVAMILLSNNTRLCSGCMLNNVKGDQIPYFLTAFHCVEGEDVKTWIFMFNYESYNCDNNDGNTSNTILGSDLISYSDKSDFALLKLAETPPDDYNVYYAGWSNLKSDTTDSSVVIHHPSGDIKKISFSYPYSRLSDWGTSMNYSHVEVPYWSIGTTEMGSSGAPLFNKHHKVIGQLHGGDAACYNQYSDYFGSFYYSWVAESVIKSMKKLSNWLDPDSTNATACGGRFFNISTDSSDLKLVQINRSNSELCKNSLIPEIKIKNVGQKAVTQFTLNYFIDNNFLYKYDWIGNLESSLEINLTTDEITNLTIGIHKLKIIINSVNNYIDDNRTNDTLNYNFSVAEGAIIKMELMTDNYGEETKLFLIRTDNGSEIIYESNDTFASNYLYVKEFCLPNGCYYAKIEDKEKDGLCTVINGNKPGYFKVYVNNQLISENCDFEKEAIIRFGLDCNDYKKYCSNAIVFPNPLTESNLTINIDNKDKLPAVIEVYNYLGAFIMSYKITELISEIKIPKNINTGLYIFNIKYSGGNERVKVIIIN
ncbi:MAG: hypothetical protein A2X12_00920 [Bacteroidetes bacterium GWE2_29_8]|nr:MAG: hypothetical protein A2X12_00920 [Bacteroidetes bacterium GWE2_29_8]OFY15639.1 MAG: hypothetical protein A2X02_06390 [Bacteroidetes bacterium GWF2_29_10]